MTSKAVSHQFRKLLIVTSTDVVKDAGNLK